MNRRGVLWIVLLLGLIAGSYIFLARLNAARHREGPDGSTYTAGPAGYKAAYLLLQESGIPVARRRRPWSSGLPARGLLVVAEQRRPASGREWEAMLNWVNRGGTVLFCSRIPWSFWPVQGKQSIGTLVAQDFEPLIPGALTAGVARLNLAALFRLKGPLSAEEPGRAPAILAGDRQGAAVLYAPYGRGRAILVADPGFLANDRLRSAPDNAVFLLNLARSFGVRRVQFDEYHLGFSDDPRPEDAERLARLPAAVTAVQWQLLLLALLYFLMAGRRFGRPIALPETGGRTITEYLDSLATLYQRAQANTAALDHLYQGLVERMRLLTGLSSAAGTEALARAAAARLGRDGEDLQRLLARCRAVQARGSITAAELTSLAKRIDYYRKEFEKWGTLPR